MEENIIKDYENVHDNKILSYNVDFINQKLTIETEYDYKKEHTSILFEELLAHHFEDITKDNIIFSVVMISLDWFFEYYKDFLENSFKYGFPTPIAGSINELGEFLTSNKYNVFEIDSSVGLHGIVIAKNILIDTKNY